MVGVVSSYGPGKIRVRDKLSGHRNIRRVIQSLGSARSTQKAFDDARPMSSRWELDKGQELMDVANDLLVC